MAKNEKVAVEVPLVAVKPRIRKGKPAGSLTLLIRTRP